ncbi:MAG: TonB-dependent receptor [Tannerella sp.]|jgi:TonB-linked SusC/RagA family outer membrane protein|nr:TonB-dependent receptor [Tannerella sp.]
MKKKPVKLLFLLFCTLSLSAEQMKHETLAAVLNPARVEVVIPAEPLAGVLNPARVEVVIPAEPLAGVLNPARVEALQQRKSITGAVSDETGEPLPGASVLVKGTPRGVIADADGTFKIDVSTDDVLEISYIGYEPLQVKVGSQTYISIKLEPKKNELDEVTVVAFGKQKKESIVGAITTVRPSDLKVPSSNLTTSLAGRVAGLISYQRSGEPGMDNADFFVRGVTTFGYKQDPLILIDGIELTTTDLARLQVDDIASFSIMKDATATALYGARGANGVILVTTKQGSEGRAKLSVRIENSFSSPTDNVELADPVTFMRLENEAVLTRDPLGITRYSDAKIARTANGEDPLAYPANDWRQLMFKNYAANQRVNLSVSGGGTIARYYVAASYSKDNGMLKVDKRNNFNSNIDLRKYTLRSNVNINITKSTELVVRLSGSFDDYSGPIDGGKEMYNKVMHANPVLFPAYFPVTDSYRYINHILFGNYEQSGFMRNPYADMVRGYKEYTRSQMIAQFEAKQNLEAITKGLSLRAMFNTTRNAYFDVTRAYNPFYYSFAGYDVMTGERMLTVLNEDTGTEYLGYAEGVKTITSDVYFESALDYNREFDRHGVSGMLVFIAKNTIEANAGGLHQSLPHRNLGLSGRATYAYDKRYFTELNFGYNGSERFHKKHRFGFFPAIGLGWSISNEQFFEPMKAIVTNLKLRGTYGLVGNDAIGGPSDRFFYLSQVNMNDGGKAASFGENQNTYLRNGITVNNYSNENITWEVSKKQNYAVEIGLWDKINIIAEYFRDYREKILMTRSYIPNTMGLSSTASIRANSGEASSRGTDISLDYNQAWGSHTWLSIRGNFTYATNRYEVYEEPIYKEPWRTRIGYSIDQTRGYIAEKLFIDDAEVANSPRQFGDYKAGDIKYTDVNRDGVITGADMVPIGYPTKPEIVYGFGFSLGYKNIDFSTFFQGLANESFWISYAATAPFVNETQILKQYADSHWSEDNRNVYAIWPRLSNYLISNNNQTSTWFMRDGSFLRLKQLEIGYTLPDNLLANIKASTCRIYFSGTNLLLFSRFKMWDVEMGGEGLGYPIQKTLNIGLNVSF